MLRVNFVAVGSNLSFESRSSLQLCVDSIQKIARIPGIRGLVCSPWYSAAAQPDSRQPRFVNAVVRFATDDEPERLLYALHGIESELGRVRGAANAPRTLDLDIIDAGGQVRSTRELILPHPRADSRAFVLLPLRDVAPAWRHPRLGRTVRELLAALPPQDVRRL